MPCQEVALNTFSDPSDHHVTKPGLAGWRTRDHGEESEVPQLQQ